MRRAAEGRQLIAATVMFALLLAGCGGGDDGGGGDASAGGSASDDSQIELVAECPTAEAGPDAVDHEVDGGAPVVWARETGGASETTSPVDGVLVFEVVAATEGLTPFTLALDQETGERLWCLTGDLISPSQSVDDSSHQPVLVYDQVSLHAVDARTGEQLWESQPGETLVARDAAMIILEESGTWRAVDASTGEELWSHELGDNSTTGCIGEDTVVLDEIDGENTTIVGLDLADGTEMWREAGGSLSCMPGTGYALLSTDDTLASISLADGELGPDFPRPSQSFYTAAGSEVVVTYEGTAVYAHRASDAQELWASELDGELLAVDHLGETVVLTSADTVTVHDAETGAAVGDLPVDEDVDVLGQNGPVLVMGSGMEADESRLFAVDLGTDTELWSIDGITSANPGVIADGIFYIHTSFTDLEGPDVVAVDLGGG